jgi:hypothetical protein
MLAVSFALLLAEATSLPSPTSSACPTRGVMRLDHGAWVPSAPFPPMLPSPGPPREFFSGYVSGPWLLVDVNANGSVKGTRLLESAGHWADTRALHIARTSRYRPKMVGCRAVEGIYYLFYPVAVM